MVKCPCCGYDTLSEEGGYEICDLCHWEDDPLARIEPPDRIVGGPNGDYSLKEARENFKKYYIMYRQENPTQYFEKHRTEIDLKKKIIEAFEDFETPHSEEYKRRLKSDIEIMRKQLHKIVYG